MNINCRIENLRQSMKSKGCECLILAPSTDLQYVTGFSGISMERPIFLALTLNKAFFIIPEFELENLSEELRETVSCVTWKEEDNPYKKAIEVLRNENIHNGAIGDQAKASLFYNLQQIFPEWEWKLSGEIMSELRSRKTEEEYARLKKAQLFSGRALERLLQEGLSGKTEMEAALRLNEFMREEGLECEGIPLVAAGANGALPHHGADDTLIKKNDTVIIDFGGSYKGYHADITRTVVVGDVSEKFENIYRIVRKANECVFKSAKPGMTGEELDKVAREIIEDAGYGRYFTHRLGHGIGLDVHEEPYIVKGNDMELTEGNVFSNEPGIYLPGQFGIRLEDVLFLRKDGAECLTELTHDILVTV